MKKYVLIFISSFLVFLLIIGGIYFYVSKSRMVDTDFNKTITENPDLKPPDPTESPVVNVLIMGVDEARSDVMMLASFNKDNNKMTMLSIPRDTRVDIPGYGYDKINSAAARKEGTALSMETVSNMLNIPIHHYIKVDFKGAEKIIDILGGVTVDVPINMNYDDPAQNLSIHIKKGRQLLNGANAVKFVRFRSGYPDQDLGRIKAQQQFAKAFIEKITSPSVLPKALSLVNAMTRCTKTNMTDGEIASYALKLKDIKLDEVKFYTLPGKADYLHGISYFMYDEIELRNTMNSIGMDLGVVKDTSQAAAPDGENGQTASVGMSDSTGAGTVKVDKSRIKIQILNSTGKKGLATKLRDELKAKGYSAITVGDATNLNYNYSRIIDRKGNKDNTELLAADSGISMTESDIDNSCEYDITIIIGKDRQ